MGKKPVRRIRLNCNCVQDFEDKMAIHYPELQNVKLDMNNIMPFDRENGRIISIPSIKVKYSEINPKTKEPYKKLKETTLTMNNCPMCGLKFEKVISKPQPKKRGRSLRHKKPHINLLKHL